MQKRRNRVRTDRGSRWRWLRVTGWGMLVVLTSLSWAQEAEEVEEAPAARQFNSAALIRFEGMIQPILEQYFYRKLDKAKALGVDLVIVEIDSPGGYVHTTLDIAERLDAVDWAHVAAFVPREALSGAALISLGCNEIVMAPGARIGDAGPIFQDDDALFRHAPEKIRSDLVRRVRDMAEAKGRPPAVTEAMVDMDLEVFRCTHRDTGEVRWMSEPELQEDGGAARWDQGAMLQESRQGLFLEVNGAKALEIGLVEGNADDRAALVQYFQLPKDPVVMETTWVDTTVMILNFPVVTGLLFVIGLVALFIEFSAPGISVGGLVAGLCFVLFFWSRFLGGTSGWLEILLFLCGVVFLCVELFVIPGFGVAGVAGILLMVAGLVMASQDFVPMDGLRIGNVATSLLTVVGAGAVSLVAMVALSNYYGSIPILNRLALEPPVATNADEEVIDDETGKPRTPTSTEGPQIQVGDWGLAESPLRPAGKVAFGDEYVDVVTDGSFVDKGKQVRVLQVSGNRIVVREIDETA